MSARVGCAGSLFLFLVACGGGSTEPPPTYFSDVKPIIDAKCIRCHQEGGVAPFAFGEYKDAVAHAGISRLAIRDNLMPPWLAADGCNDYVGDFSLTEEEKEIFDRWVEADTPAGDSGRIGEAIPLEDVSLSRVDLTLAMPTAYTPTKSPDDYRCFLIEWPEAEATKYVTGFRAQPGNRKNVHHIIAFLGSAKHRALYEAMDAREDGPGYTCFGGPGGPSRSWLGGWAPGSEGSDLPAGSGIPIEPGTFVILQVHYNTLTAAPESDQSAVEVSMADAVEQIAHVQPWADPFWLQPGGMPIPANQKDVRHSFGFDPTPFVSDGSPMVLHGAALHMHTLGETGKLSIVHSDGSQTCLLDIPRWDFKWQGGYAFRQPVVLQPGDQLNIECSWDNTQGNQQVVDGRPLPPRDVEWGEGTTDEMCLGAVTWTLK